MLKLLRARHALAGVEFAIMLPLLLSLLFGLVDLSRVIILARRLTAAAAATVTIASTMAVQATNLNALSGTQAWQASTAPFASFPEWSSRPLTGNFSVTLTAVTFKPAKSGYTAQVAWSVANPSGQTRLRTCGALTPNADGAPVNLATLPADTFGPTSLLVADVTGVFVPVFTAVFTGPVTLTRSSYVSPRINNEVSLYGSFPGPFVQCSAAGS